MILWRSDCLGHGIVRESVDDNLKFNVLSFIVDLQYIFNCLSRLSDLSASQLVNGMATSIFGNCLTFHAIKLAKFIMPN